MVACALLLIGGGLIAALVIRNPERPTSVKDQRRYCAIDGPPMQPKGAMTDANAIATTTPASSQT